MYTDLLVTQISYLFPNLGGSYQSKHMNAVHNFATKNINCGYSTKLGEQIWLKLSQPKLR